MAIIDLNTGKIDPEGRASVSLPPEPEVTRGRVIDLDTGKFADPAPDIEAAPQQVITQEPEIIPQEQPLTVVRGAQQVADVAQQVTEPFRGVAPLIAEAVRGGGETRATRELPELGQGGLLAGQDLGKVAAITPILATTFDPAEIAQIVTSTFPDIGVTQDEEGNLSLGNNITGARVVINKPGLSGLDIIQGLATAAAFTPAAGAAGITTRGAAETTKALIAKRVALGAAGAGLTETAIQTAQEAAGGEFDVSDIALSTTLGGVAEAVVPGIQGIRQGRQEARVGAQRGEVEQVREAIQPAQEAVTELERATGQKVGLFPAQQTQQPSELLKQRLLPQLDAGSKRAASALERQNEEVFEATSRLVNAIAGPEGISMGAKRFKNAAEKSIAVVKRARAETASPIYKQAFRRQRKGQLDPINTGKLETKLENIIRQFDPKDEVSANLSKILKSVEEAKGDLSKLHRQKTRIDELIEGTRETSVGRTTKRFLSDIQRDLVDDLVSQSPSYRAARDEFIRLSPPIVDIEESIIGVVSKFDDVSLKRVAQTIFDPKEALTNPTVIKNAKRIIDKIDPGAWDDLLRVEMNRRIGGLKELVEDIPGELVGNVPGQLRRALFGNPSQRNALLSGMNQSQKKNFIFLENVLKRASSGRAAGSPTAPFQEAIRRLRGITGVLRDVIFRPLDTAKRVGESGLFDRNVAALTEVMFDPRWQPRLQQLRQLSPDSPNAGRAFIQVLKDAGAGTEGRE